jgi:hypothetical protein
MTKRRRTDNTMTKRRTDNTMTKRRTDNTPWKHKIVFRLRHIRSECEKP